MTKPTFTETIKAFTLTHPLLGKLHTDEEADVAELLKHVEDTHRGADCCHVAPCPAWVEAEQLAVLYLGRAQDRVGGKYL